MADRILPSKLIGERVEVRFNFLDVLEWGDSISAAQFTAAPAIGTDSLPSLLIYKAVSFTATEAWQKIHRGVSGVTYRIQCTVQTLGGKSYEKWAYLSILPDNALIPPITADWYTSRPYPVEAVDDMTAMGAVTRISSLGFSEEEYLTALGAVVSMALTSGLTFARGDDDYLTASAEVLTAELWGGVTSARGDDDFLTASALVVAADLFGNVVQHTQPAEDFLTASAMVTGATLT